MATVRITPTLQNEIDYEVRRQFETRRRPLEQKMREVLAPTPEFTRAIAATIRADQDTSEMQLAAVDNWLTKVERLTLASINGVQLPYQFQTCSLTEAVPIPVRAAASLHNLNSPRLSRWATETKAILEQIDALAAEEAAFRKQVKLLLDSVPTYKRALEAWPQLISVTPRHILDRHELVVERAAKEYATPAVDVDALNLTAVMNTIARSTSGERA